jgi:hypothetical protein
MRWARRPLRSPFWPQLHARFARDVVQLDAVVCGIIRSERIASVIRIFAAPNALRLRKRGSQR